MDDAALSDVDVATLVSRHTQDEYRVLVGRPGESTDAVLPLVALDATISFGTLVEITRLLAASEDLPPLLVVGVGYRERRFGDALGRRQRDLTFSASAAGGSPDEPAMMGGGCRFTRFLEDELRPWLTERYAVRHGDWGIIGSSLAGLFVTHLLLRTPRMFQRYGIGSPSYWWDDKAIFQPEAWSPLPDDLAARVAITVGEHEHPDGRRRYLANLPEARRSQAIAQDDGMAPPDMVGDARRMYRLLLDHASLHVNFEVIPNEYHQTVIPTHLSRAVRLLYDGPV